MTRLRGKVALVTGGGTGIGRACALLFAREGAQVAVAARRAAPLAAVTAEMAKAGAETLAVECDVTQARHTQDAMRAIVGRFGRLDVVVNNAGALIAATAEETSEGDWDRIIDVNVKGTFLVSRAALPELRKTGGGSVINIGSILSLVGMKKRAAYCAAKGGVLLLTRAMAVDHAHERIRFNCICPGLVKTELVRGLFTGTPEDEALLRQRIEQIPLGRVGQPEDVARLAVFLASEESSWITGAALPVDGGFTAY
ncbi:MAG TPA: glucose 1-dehydrogenase [Candidatus Acidoferrales bacterium]|nr:glucose 1-dehydrogenase [Candidatus Acidoferrales bacterium]